MILYSFFTHRSRNIFILKKYNVITWSLDQSKQKNYKKILSLRLKSHKIYEDSILNQNLFLIATALLVLEIFAI